MLRACTARVAGPVLSRLLCRGGELPTAWAAMAGPRSAPVRLRLHTAGRLGSREPSSTSSMPGGPVRITEWSADRRFLTVAWSSGEESVYPLVWLRYNCQCAACFHPVSMARQILGRDMVLEPCVHQLTVDGPGQRLAVQWHDGHESEFGFGWLLERSFSEERRAARLAEVRGLDLRRAWGRGVAPAVVDFKATVASDEGLLRLISALKVRGLCIVANAPGVEEPLDTLGRLFGYALPTNYGHNFEVTSKTDPSNVAYTSSTLGLHNDLNFYTVTPGIQMLHCVRQTEDVQGGANLFADSLFAARRLRQEDPKAFDLLATERVVYWDYGSDFVPEFHLRQARPVLELDEATGEMAAITYNHQVNDSRMVMPVETVPDFFRAVYRLETLLMEEATYWRLQPGQIAVFDNTRVLHGREGFTMTGDSADRYLRGIYCCWDEVNSIYRRLKERCHVEED